jgi:cyclopropane-fatty-acyl-phospholipid synthase
MTEPDEWILDAPPARPRPLDRLARRPVLGMLARIREGRLMMSLPDGASLAFGPSGGPVAALWVRRERFFRRVLLEADLGFGDAFVDGDWETPDLPGLIEFLIRNAAAVDDRRIGSAALGRLLHRIRHRLNRNTVPGSRRNIRRHYDLGNDFFRLFLDPTMTYSCALWREGDTLEQAQRRKLRAVLEKARLAPEHHLLEIGSGWGSFALEAAASAGCRVTTVTISEEQHRLARERVREAGLEGRVEVLLRDFRRLEGAFDRIVSIEMLEAVGHENFPAFFRALDRLLKPDGLAVVQVITIPDQRYEAYRRTGDWIQRAIFPGALLPSLTALSAAMTRHSALTVEHLENIGPHYPPTLRAWREALLAHREEALAQGRDERFLRAWEYYFAYCEAGFRARHLNDLQLVLTRPGNHSLGGGAA